MGSNKPGEVLQRTGVVLKGMSAGGWIVMIVLLALLAAACVIGYLGWTSASDTAVPPSGYIALVIGVTFSLLVGCGLMALVFYSSRHGHDEPVYRIEDDEQPKP